MPIDALAALLEGSFRGTLAKGIALSGLTTYRLGGPAALYLEPADARDLEFFGRAVRAAGLDGDSLPMVAIGRGSNLVVSDEGWPGVVVRLGPAFSWIEDVPNRDDATGAYMRAGGATSLPLLANWTARRGLAGLEFTVAIPGSVGGAVKMNAGAHGGAISDRLVSVHLFDLDELEIEERSAMGLDLDYRKSNLTERNLVLDACFKLSYDDPSAVRDRIESYRRHRSETQPGALGNAGSVFKNPVGDSAGRLVEAAGLKGFRVGGAAVSDLHANFFIADRSATAQDVFDLVATVRDRVRAEFGVELEPEIRFLGSFRKSAAGNGVIL